MTGDIDLVAGLGAARLVRALAARWGTQGYRFRRRGVTTWRFKARGAGVDIVDASRRGLDADLRRRELTINAVAYDPVGRRLHDPLRGLSDLRRRQLRAPAEDVFTDDPVRVLRLARFLAELPEFGPTRTTERWARAAAPRLRRAAAERLRDELDKLLIAPAAARGLEFLTRLGAREALLPELAPLAGCVAGADRPDVWSHTVEAVRFSQISLPGLHASRWLRAPSSRRLLRWALLLHDIAKPATFDVRPDGRPSFHGHETLGARQADRLLRRLRQPRAMRGRVGRLIRLHLRPSQLAESGATPRGCRRLVRDAGEDLPLLVLHAACDALASGSPDARVRWPPLRRTLKQLLLLDSKATQLVSPPLLDGHDLMDTLNLPPSPTIGHLLLALREAQQLGEIATRDAALTLARQLLVAGIEPPEG
jgi:poly(A) polymerase